MWLWCQLVNSQGGLIHLDGLGALVYRFTLVGESLMAAELRRLREAAVTTLTPVTHTEKEKTQETDKRQWYESDTNRRSENTTLLWRKRTLKAQMHRHNPQICPHTHTHTDTHTHLPVNSNIQWQYKVCVRPSGAESCNCCPDLYNLTDKLHTHTHTHTTTCTHTNSTCQ